MLFAALTAAVMSVEELPVIAQEDLEYARELCRALGKPFKYDYEYIEIADLNGDKKPDYLVDGRGMDCQSYTESLFGDVAGKPLYIYISQPEGGWEKALSTYIYEYYVKKNRDGNPYLDLWLRGQVGYQTNKLRYQWQNGKFEVIDQEYGVEVPKQLWKYFD